MDSYITRKGVYIDLSKSPYEYKCKDGEVLKFSSEKKLQMYRSFITLAGTKIDRAFGIAGKLLDVIDTNTLMTAQAAVEKSIYKEGSEKWRKR